MLKWSARRENKLKKLYAILTASKLSDLFGVSKNSVIGKANRLGLSKPPSGGPSKAVERRFIAAAQPPPPRIEAPAILELPFRNLTIYQVGAGECRYPQGEFPPYLFCGQLVQHGSSYCPYHHRLCYFPLTQSRRDRDMALSPWRGVR